MNPPIIPRDQAARQLAVDARVLIRYEAAGLVQHVRQGAVEGYGPPELRRIWTILSCQRDLGINLAGVEAVLKLRDHLAEVHSQVDLLASRLRDFIDDEGSVDIDG